MALERCEGIVFGHAGAVVADANERAARIDQFDLDPSRPGVESVFHQFLDDGAGALHHFAGRNLVHGVGIQQSNPMRSVKNFQVLNHFDAHCGVSCEPSVSTIEA